MLRLEAGEGCRDVACYVWELGEKNEIRVRCEQYGVTWDLLPVRQDLR
ncbi:hypothetical protein [Coleofasciculus sp.]